MGFKIARIVRQMLANMVILFILTILISVIVHGEDVMINGSFYDDDEFTLDGTEYSLQLSSRTNNIHVSSRYNSVIIKHGKCSSKGYYTFCFDGFVEDEDNIYQKASMTVMKFDCFEYVDEDGEKLCRLHVGENCTKDSQCLSGECLHGVCTFISPICGDSYCDDGEMCEADCKSEEEEEDEEDSSEEEEETDEGATIDDANETLNATQLNDTLVQPTPILLDSIESDDSASIFGEYKVYIVLGIIVLLVVIVLFVLKGLGKDKLEHEILSETTDEAKSEQESNKEKQDTGENDKGKGKKQEQNKGKESDEGELSFEKA